MLQIVRQNILLLIFVGISLNIFVLTGISAYSVLNKTVIQQQLDIIDCGDSAGRIHKCVRIDPAAGEVNDVAKGASYRVIYGR